MKWTYVIQQRHKVAVLLASVMALVVLTVLFERKNINDINESVTSIYNDRLVPASDIFRLAEQFYNKRFLMETYLVGENQDVNALRTGLAAHDQQINKLISKYEKTHLVNDESRALKEVKDHVKTYKVMENNILSIAESHSKEAAADLYEKEAKPVLTASLGQLAKLSDVQIKVGSELLRDSAGIAATSRVLSSIQIVLAIIIGMMIVALTNTARLVSSDSTKYNLN